MDRSLGGSWWLGPDHPICHRPGRAEQAKAAGSMSYVRRGLHIDPAALTHTPDGRVGLVPALRDRRRGPGA